MAEKCRMGGDVMTKIPEYGEIACNLFLAGRPIISGIIECARDNGDPAPTEAQLEAVFEYLLVEFPTNNITRG
jgi:hypothetical protein